MSVVKPIYTVVNDTKTALDILQVQKCWSWVSDAKSTNAMYDSVPFGCESSSD